MPHPHRVWQSKGRCMFDAVVIGTGPAGLMAAEELAPAGRKALVCEAKSSPARKFLMAGKSGLNITKDEEFSTFLEEFDADWLRPMLSEFGPREVVIWARALGQEVFTGSTGRVFPRSMKASPLLRAWVRVLAEKGVQITPFKPANMGFAVEWSPHMAKHFGQAIKGAALIVGDRRERGEFVISARGIEGGGVYTVSRDLREGAALRLDLMADVAAEEVAARLARMRTGESLVNRLRKLGLSPAAVALVLEFGRSLDPAQAVKSLPVRLAGPRPIDEAISTAGGVARAAVTDDLELRAVPNVFVCGEMLDWEAPTGGYLLTACWSTGRWAGRAAAQLT